ncbi:HAUS augmin-like complex subunit 6 [Smittium mucronatum]|uniref:HAUS augmin-like complex subunit 6 n=1 Tax=Smittium mucronatum TaxID=133383 RepID=A0A1R0H3M0_9FUNG|nr:HAUS augmin-like complex subunit 6 [Smittium mucronatum]
MNADKMRLQFWQLLLALGFDPLTQNYNIYSGINFDSTIFSKGIDNARAAELVLFFLLSIIDQKRSKMLFSPCFPVCEPKQSREFRSLCFKWMEELKNDNSEARIWPKWSQVRRSYFDECFGSRFENMIWGLAIAAASKKLQFNKRTNIRSAENYSYIKEILSFISNYNLVPHKHLDSPIVLHMNSLLSQSKSDYILANNDRKSSVSIFYSEIKHYDESFSIVHSKRSGISLEIRSELVFLSKKGISFSPPNSPSLQSLKSELDCWVVEIKRLLSDPTQWISTQFENINCINSILNPNFNLHDSYPKTNALTTTQSSLKSSYNQKLVLDGNKILSLCNFQTLSLNNSPCNLEFMDINKILISKLYHFDPKSNKLALDLPIFLELGTFALRFVKEKTHQLRLDQPGSLSHNSLHRSDPDFQTNDVSNFQHIYSLDSHLCDISIQKTPNTSIDQIIDRSMEETSLAINRVSTRIDKLTQLKSKLMSIIQK